MRSRAAADHPTPDRTRSRQRAARLLATRQFDAAGDCYRTLTATDTADPEDLTGLGTACRATGDISGAVDAYRRAYRGFLAGDDPAAAALGACHLADLELSELGGPAVAAGWLARARRHLDALPDHPANVTLDGLDAYRLLAYQKDPDAALGCAARAVAMARRIGDAVAETTGKAYLGLIEVYRGNLAAGFALLDESAAAAVAGELPFPDDLDVYCLLITGCERVRDLDRADQWTRRVLATAVGPGSDSFAAFARTHFAALLIWRGRWEQADRELERVLVDTSGHPMSAAVALTLRVSLHRRRGRLIEARRDLAACRAEPFRSAVRHLVLSTQSALELDDGHPERAAELAERYLTAVSPGDLVERIEALQTLTDARLALGDPDRADAAATELEHIAATVPTDAVEAAASTARAAVHRARGDDAAALRLLEWAVGRLDDAGMVPDAVTARLAMARVLLDLGRVSGAVVVAEAAAADAASVGSGPQLAAARSLLRRTRPEPRRGEGGTTTRERQVLRLIADGLSNAEIATALVLSPRTVERHVSNIYAKFGVTGPTARTVVVAGARRLGLLDGTG